MDAPPAARGEFEMLHRVGDINQPPVDAGFFQRLVQQLSRRSNERAADHILLIAWLFADEHHARATWPFAEHGLRGRPA